jgi:hypothetical protein
MNERIKELTINERIKKLTISAITECFDDQLDRYGDLDRMYIPFEFSERFAKLIVNECVDLILQSEEDVFDEEDPNNPYYQGMIRGKLDDCHLLKDTFGIK